jgi:hypothetical protein
LQNYPKFIWKGFPIMGHSVTSNSSSSGTLQLLLQSYWKLRAMILLVLLCLIAALVMVFVRRAWVLPILAAAVLIHLLLLRPLQSRYSSAITRANLLQTTCKYLGTDVLSEKKLQHIHIRTLEDASLMPCGDEHNHPLLRWEIRGEKKGMTITLCDAAIPQRFQLAKRGKKRVHFNSGVWAHITLPADSGLHFKLLDETSVPTPIRMDYFAGKPEYGTASIADPTVARRFVLYRTKDSSDQPTAPMLKKIRALMDYTPGYLALSVDGDRMDFFLRGRFLARAVSVSKKPTEQLLAFDPFPELSYLIDIAYSTIYQPDR